MVRISYGIYYTCNDPNCPHFDQHGLRQFGMDGQTEEELDLKVEAEFQAEKLKTFGSGGEHFIFPYKIVKSVPICLICDPT